MAWLILISSAVTGILAGYAIGRYFGCPLYGGTCALIVVAATIFGMACAIVMDYFHYLDFLFSNGNGDPRIGFWELWPPVGLTTFATALTLYLARVGFGVVLRSSFPDRT